MAHAEDEAVLGVQTLHSAVAMIRSTYQRQPATADVGTTCDAIIASGSMSTAVRRLTGRPVDSCPPRRMLL